MAVCAHIVFHQEPWEERTRGTRLAAAKKGALTVRQAAYFAELKGSSEESVRLLVGLAVVARDSLTLSEQLTLSALEKTFAGEQKRPAVLLVIVMKCLFSSEPGLRRELRQEILSKALAGVKAIGREHSRSEALADLAPYLTVEQRAEALAAAEVIIGERHRAEAVAALAPYLTSEQLGEALVPVLAVGRAGEALAPPRASANQLSIAQSLWLRWPSNSNRGNSTTYLPPPRPPATSAFSQKLWLRWPPTLLWSNSTRL